MDQEEEDAAVVVVEVERRSVLEDRDVPALEEAEAVEPHRALNGLCSTRSWVYTQSCE